MFQLSQTKDLTDTDDIDLFTIGDKPTALFCIPSKELPQLNLLLTMLYTQLFPALYYQAEHKHTGRYTLPRHVRVILDGLDGIGLLPDLPNKMSTMRPYNISCAISSTPISSLKSMYPKDWQVVLGNCDALLFYGPNNADECSECYGFRNLFSGTSARDIRRSAVTGVVQRLLPQINSKTATLTPETIANMKEDDCIVCVRGSSPIIDKRYLSADHPNIGLCVHAPSTSPAASM